MDKKKRLKRIREILESTSVPNQEHLRKILHQKGIAISQTSLSRDLNTIGATRVRNPSGAFQYILPGRESPGIPFAEFGKKMSATLLDIKRAGNILLLFTPPGEAQLAGKLLDRCLQPGLLGTVAGDDTLISVCRNTSIARDLERRFRRFIH